VFDGVDNNTFKGELNFTERELYRIKTLTEMNGDVMFIDAVKHLLWICGLFR
jgi:hypothetical protein